ncbi:MAG: DUF2062 domain-containing protein [Planctomycetes bacterium]|nr:DUF2062 domain-containing protein [Planctomycetota bacterium]
MKLQNKKFFRKLFRPAVGFVKFRILHVYDTPQRIARGIAVGLWIGFTPLLGLHMILALAIAALFRANKILAVLGVWISNPFTLLPIYGSAYLAGRFPVGRFHPSHAQPGQVGDLLSHIFSLSNMVTRLHTTAFWKEVAVVFGKIGLEVTIGGFVLGTLFAIMGYFATYWIVTNHRIKSGRRRFRQLL